MPNRLAAATSPYLRQHAANPVDWQEWGEAAFAQARAEQKPIFLSIGYSTCHWCHVMARESFEHPEVAALLNASFVAIKVDREERPDVDRVYMTYVQALTGHGGWPLSTWLTPELKPFFGGTYFPPEDRHGRPGFPTLLRSIIRAWENERDKLVAEGDRVLGALATHYAEQAASASPASEVDLHAAASEAYEKAWQHYYENFDATEGGFGGAPKFPRPAELEFLLRAAIVQGRGGEVWQDALPMVERTLQAMAMGGIHDHVGGGLHRYAVDAGWHVPHFEKMLYDQAQLVSASVAAYQASGDGRFAWLARDLLGYVARDLTHPEGGFFAAEDADSTPPGAPAHAHAEGAFYVWTADEIAAACGADAALVSAHFDVQPGGNVAPEHDPHGEFTGKNILRQRRPLGQTARSLGLAPEEAEASLVAALARLRAVRAARPRPHRDEKIITAWNGLMIGAAARAVQVIGGAEAADWTRLAVRAAEFLRTRLCDAAGSELSRSWSDGRVSGAAVAEDYAALGHGLLELYGATFDVRWLQWADQLQTRMDALFWDDAAGGYFSARADDASVVLRLKEDHDGAEPSASSLAAANLFRLGGLLHDEARIARGQQCVEAFRYQWQGRAPAMPAMLTALELAVDVPRHVVLAGDPAAPAFRALVAVLHAEPGPRRHVLAVDGGAAQAWLATRAPWLRDMRALDGQPTAYVCERFTCRAPATTPEALREALLG